MSSPVQGESRKTGGWRHTLSQVTAKPQGRLGALILIVFILIALASPFIVPYDPIKIYKGQRLKPPSAQFYFGTDELSRDIFSRTLVAARISVGAAATVVIIAAGIGVPLGLLAGYFRGRVDTLIMRLIDVILAFPAVLLAMAIIAILGPNTTNAMIAVAIVNIPAFSRITRASVLSLREREFVEASRAIGARDGYLMFQVLLPNCLSPILVQCTLSAGAAILLEAGLSFLGLGTQPPAPSWGSMLFTARSYLRDAPWYGLFPGMFITMLVMGLTLLSEALQES